MDKKTEFFSYEDVHKEIAKLFIKEHAFLHQVLSLPIIEHVGSSAVPGALTKKDLDIQIRVPGKYFPKAVLILCDLLAIHHREIWNEQFAVFTGHDKDIHIDYMVTVIDSPYDTFYKVRDYLRTHPDMLERYDALKLEYEGKEYLEYSRAKVEFFGSNGNVKFLH
jgi:GrpB-like predicted nucleotidyltransferase (UPF0157 family)